VELRLRDLRGKAKEKGGAEPERFY